jgi:hypothetical protein
LFHDPKAAFAHGPVKVVMKRLKVRVALAQEFFLFF